MMIGKSCDPCLFENEEVNASHWCVECCEALCEDCVKAHKKAKISRSHKLISLDEYESNPPRINVTKMCDKHPDKKLETFCVDHQMPCCLVCMTTHHRKCDHVTTLEEAAKGVSESSEMKQLMSQLVKESSKFHEIANDKRVNLQELKIQKQECETEVAKLKTNVVCHIEKLEQKFKDDLNILNKVYCSQLNEELEHFEHLKKTRDTYISLLEMARSKTTDVNTFLEMVAIQQLVKEQYENLRQRFPVLKQVKYTMEESEMARSVINSFHALAEVRVDQKKLCTRELFQNGVYDSVDFAKCTLRETSSFNLQKTQVQFADVEYLGSDKVILTDKKTLSIYTEDGASVKETVFSSEVHSVALLSEHEIVVTLPSLRSFAIINVNNMSKKNYEIDEKCYGITLFKSNLVLACMSAIMFVDTKGNVLSKKTVTSCVDFISSVSHDRLCYTNHFQHFVHCMDGSNKDI